MDLSIIVVSFNTRELTEACLQSIYKELDKSGLKGEVVVVDNHSIDGSAQSILKNFPRVHFIKNVKNLGFSRANNQGAVSASGKYLLFLNSDAQLMNESLLSMDYFFEHNSRVGVASCQLVNPDGSIQPQGGWLPRLSTVAVWAWFLDDLPILRRFLPSYQFQHASLSSGRPKATGWVAGTAMWVRREVWDQLGGFDESLFMYGEDVDLCYRARKCGWQVMINPEARVVHQGQGSANDASWIKREVMGLRHIFKKHKPSWEMPILRFILKTGMVARWVIFGILKNDPVKRGGYADAFWNS